MINVITVHWMSAKWVPAQLAYLERNLNVPYRTVASLNGIDDPGDKGDVRLRGRCRGRSSGQAQQARRRLSSRRPTRPTCSCSSTVTRSRSSHCSRGSTRSSSAMGWLRSNGGENCDDIRPHPCFCAMTVKTWKELGGDWGVEEWTSSVGMLFDDAGGILASTLRENRVDWLPLLRTNTSNPHPLWFAVYGHRIYHHGAGFRSRVSKLDRSNTKALTRVDSIWSDPSLGQLSVNLRRNPSVMLQARPRHVATLARAARRTALQRFKRRFDANAQSASDEVFDRISSDEHFYRAFDSTLS